MIEGTWRGGEVTEALVAAEWDRKAARFVFEANGAGQHLVTTLDLRGSQWQAFPDEVFQFAHNEAPPSQKVG